MQTSLNRIFSLLVLLALAAFAFACGNDDGDDDSGDPRDLFYADRVLNIAHRGGRNLWPEHTLLAYENALTVGTDVLELDLHTTADGIPVAMHDDTVDRTTDGTGPIHEFTLAELKELDAGYRFSDDGGQTFPYRGQGLTVPTLQEIVDTFPEQHLVIEIKQYEPSMVDEMMQVIIDAGMERYILTGAFNDDTNAEIRSSYPDITTNLSMGEVVTFWSLTPETETDYTPPGEFHQVPVKFEALTVLDEAYVARARRFEMPVHAWTINDPAEMERLIEMGVNGIITDDPLTLQEILDSQN